MTDRVARVLAQEPQHTEPTPYRWVGDKLIHIRDGHLAGTLEDFPQLAASKRLRQKGRPIAFWDQPDFGVARIPLLSPPVEADQRSDGDAQVEPATTGRNEPCPCGSGRKFKRCCGG